LTTSSLEDYHFFDKERVIMKKTTSAIAVLITFILLAGCRERDKTAGKSEPAYPVAVEFVDGIKTVRNPEFPKEGAVRYSLREELTIGGEGGGTESVLNRPQDLKLDSSGNIYVMDWGDVDIKVFAPDGRFLRTISKKGQGPGEIDVPAFFVISADDKIIILSSRQHQISVLADLGTYLSGFKVEGFCQALGVDRNQRIYYGQLLTPEPIITEEYQKIENKMALFQADYEGKAKVKLGEYLDNIQLRKIAKSKAGVSSLSFTSREAYKTSWIVGPDDRTYLGYNRDYQLDVYNPEWKVVFRFDRDFTPIRHPAYSPDRGHPEFYPAFSDWRKFFDERGNLWLEQYVAEGVEDHVFDVFSPEGIYLKQVRVPETLFLVRGDKAYSIIRTEEEFLVVKRFQIVPSEEQEK
jgi:hypothetical protein